MEVTRDCPSGTAIVSEHGNIYCHIVVNGILV